MSFLSPLRSGSILRTATRVSPAQPLGARSWSSNAFRSTSSRPRPAARATGASLFARPFTVTTVTASLFGFLSNPREILGTSEAGSIVREASPAAPTKQAYTLVFVSADPLRVKRSQWQSWIMYFREAGYDCIDMNVDLPKELPEGVSQEEQLAREVIGQVRLSSLQRQPVIFLRDQEEKLLPAYLGQGGLFGRRGPMSGLVMLHPSSAEASEKADWPGNTPILIVPKSAGEAQAWEGTAASVRNTSVLTDEWNEKEGLVKEVERWLRSSGL
ncbi:hypothetical protein MOBT1_002692 [Malassezia obtusa]|uniref:Uncharacterized protein n=1 Tax=Malassezia obtusa TaxID=76774 RepID=A0AAF0ISS5_9BASI|nr:hypothetical protein MOBT1_002692 [Malassezia obtusa]